MSRKPKPRTVLPAPCSECRPYDGAWRKDAYTQAMERCTCERGRILAAGLGRKRKRIQKPGFDGRQAATGE